MAYHMAAMWPERVDKVVISSGAVNLNQRDTHELMKKAKVDKIEDLLTAKHLRALLSYIAVRPHYKP